MSSDATDGTTEPLPQQLMSQAKLISQLRNDLDNLAHETTDTIADLISRIEDLQAAPSTNSRTPTAWCWRDLGPKTSENLWTQLTDWVTWLRSRYPLAHKIPDCWTEHPEVVEELTALWLAWQAAYTQPSAPLTAPADWHDRWLPGLLRRLESGYFANDCIAHHPPRPNIAYANRESH